MGDATPDPQKKAMGRGMPGRSGQSDGQMVAETAPPIPDDEVAMPNRMSNDPSQGGNPVNDQGDQPATATGLGKPTGNPTEFGQFGRLPPDQLRNLREFLGQTKKIRENIRALMLALDRHNLPTTDLKKVLHRLIQIELAAKGGNGVEIRLAYEEAVEHVNNAEKAIATSIELRRRQQADYKKRLEYDSAAGADNVPEGYKDIVRTYFKRLAEQSTNPK